MEDEFYEADATTDADTVRRMVADLALDMDDEWRLLQMLGVDR
ncbi:hypothetical protein [Streptomyces sp. NRRL F-4489]|nr:hypothetical protein [Streptomyces sp. NRRL F-4489]